MIRCPYSLSAEKTLFNIFLKFTRILNIRQQINCMSIRHTLPLRCKSIYVHCLCKDGTLAHAPCPVPCHYPLTSTITHYVYHYPAIILEFHHPLPSSPYVQETSIEYVFSMSVWAAATTYFFRHYSNIISYLHHPRTSDTIHYSVHHFI